MGVAVRWVLHLTWARILLGGERVDEDRGYGYENSDSDPHQLRVG